MTTHALGTVGPMYSDRFQIQPIAAARGIHLGMILKFGNGNRVGTAKVEHVDVDYGVIRVEDRLNLLVPAILEGDEVHEWEVPCTRCRCKQCEAVHRVGTDTEGK